MFSLLLTIAIHFNEWWAPLNDAFRDGDAVQIVSNYYIAVLLVYFMGFLIAIDLAPNVWAELSGLQDRQFY